MTKDEALTLALEALEAIYTVGDVACVVKPEGEIYLKPVIDKCKEALAQLEIDPWREAVAQPGRDPWREAVAQPEERNFCSRCGKRLASGFVEISIHTCTPPREKNK